VVRKSVRDVPETEGVLPRNRESKGRGGGGGRIGSGVWSGIAGVG